MLGACDYHSYGSACFVWNALTIPNWHQLNHEQKRSSIIKALRLREREKIKVLTYQDREIFDRNKLWVSPVLEFVRYFRSLNFYQLLSWIIWGVLFFFVKDFLIRVKAKEWIKKRPLFIWSTVGIISAAYVFVKGIEFLIKAKPLVGYNEIYSENAVMFVWRGIAFILYSLIILITSVSKKMIEENSTKD